MAVEGEIDIAAGVSNIASDLGLGGGEEEVVVELAEDVETAEPPIEASDTEIEKPLADAVAQATVRAAPKAWAKEQHEVWGKLDPKAQDYIEHREKQMLEGLSQYGEHAKYGQSIQKALQPYDNYIKANGIDAPRAVTALFEAHKNLAEGTPEQKAAYLLKVAKNYGIDIAKAAAHASNGAEEPAHIKELRERTDRLEREQSARTEAEQQAASDRVASEITAFAEAKDDKGTPKHPYFDECHADIVAYINAGHTLEKAYEKAVYANEVTRAKELARLQTQSDAALRAKAKKEAEDARNGRSTNVNSKDTRRTPTAPKTGKWEDTMHETYAEIQSRNTH